MASVHILHPLIHGGLVPQDHGLEHAQVAGLADALQHPCAPQPEPPYSLEIRRHLPVGHRQLLPVQTAGRALGPVIAGEIKLARVGGSRHRLQLPPQSDHRADSNRCAGTGGGANPHARLQTATNPHARFQTAINPHAGFQVSTGRHAGIRIHHHPPKLHPLSPHLRRRVPQPQLCLILLLLHPLHGPGQTHLHTRGLTGPGRLPVQPVPDSLGPPESGQQRSQKKQKHSKSSASAPPQAETRGASRPVPGSVQSPFCPPFPQHDRRAGGGKSAGDPWNCSHIQQSQYLSKYETPC